MTFQPVLPPVVLAVIAVAVIALRLITMRQLYTTAGAGWSTVWRWCGLTLAVLLVLIAAARPGFDAEQERATVKQLGSNTNVFLVVDRSADSGVNDFGDSTRMAGIRADIEAVIDQYPQSRFAVLSFAARPSLDWPLSADVWSLEPTIARLAPYPADDDTQVNAAAAANVLRYQLIAASQQYPDAQNLVYYFGSGAPGSRLPQGEFDPPQGSVSGGAVLGYGTTANGPGLRRVADQLGVGYIHREAGRPFAPDTVQPSELPSGSSGVAERTELYWVFTLLAAMLLLFELYLTMREFRRTRLARRDVAL
ncbi:VWA domain-containing protein [Mycobacterium hubeiense]|uniref:VWA domain-containing protein n=1 Tax=Mycobacterium hubeiense TaxID=1867256 RepID=UPI000C7EDBFD|nr:VWA domain-containing protein [Mycobacterium sp. QGD 101]